MASTPDLAGTPMTLLLAWLALLAFVALVVELLLGVVNLVDRLRR